MECVDCEKGRFQAVSGRSSCDACPQNTFGPFTGKTSDRTCFACPLGKNAPIAGSASCACKPGALGCGGGNDLSACKQDVDLVFVLDASGSIGRTNFESMKQFVGDIVGSFNVSSTNTRVGVVTFSSRPSTVIRMGQHSSTAQLTGRSGAIASVRYTGGGTKTGAAIDFALANHFSVRGGARPANAGIPKVMVVVTDGKSFDDVNAPSKRAHAQGITVFAIGTGKNYDEQELRQIASRPQVDNSVTPPAGIHMFGLNGWDLYKILDSLRDGACDATAQVPDSGVTITPAGPSYRYFRFQFRPGQKIRFTLAQTAKVASVELSADMFVSLTERKPSDTKHLKRSVAGAKSTKTLDLGVPGTALCDGSTLRTVFLSVKIPHAGITYKLTRTIITSKMPSCDFDHGMCSWINVKEFATLHM